jgi:GPH family glycoside/pentoside/hexuronide:cation symporter
VVLRGGAVVYYINTVLNKGADIITLFMLGGMFASMAGSVLAKPFGTRFCKVKLSFWINLLTAAFGAICFIVPPQMWIAVFVIHIIISIIQGGNGALQWSMITDTNNYGEWKTQRRITGMNVAANIFVIKLGVAVGGAILGWVLAYFNYESGVSTQSSSAAQGVMLLFTLVPAVFYVLTAFSIKFYGLNETRMNRVVDDLKKGAFSHS